MTGDDCPYGTADFHATFFAGENSTGYPVPASTPETLGPRNWDHCAWAAVVKHAATNKPVNTDWDLRNMGVVIMASSGGHARSGSTLKVGASTPSRHSRRSPSRRS